MTERFARSHVGKCQEGGKKHLLHLLLLQEPTFCRNRLLHDAAGGAGTHGPPAPLQTFTLHQALM